MATSTNNKPSSLAFPLRKAEPAQSIDLLGEGGPIPERWKGVETRHKLGKDDLLFLYRQMLLMRRFEERTGIEYRKGNIKGFCHLYIGQEAVAAGSIYALKPEDYVLTAYRDHAHALARNLTAREIMAEMFMRATGCSKGKGGSMHLFNAKARMFGGHAIVGGQVPIATGIGFAIQYRNLREVVVCYMGDAAVNQGVFHEALNMASVWNCPCIFVVENNRYGMGTDIARSCAVTDFYRRTAEAYRIDGIRCDGMDVESFYSVMKEIADDCRATRRPYFVEAITYRYRGHSMSDPATTYRTQDEVKQWEGSRDPIRTLERRHPELFPQEVIDKFEAEVAAEVEDAVQFALASPFPDLNEMFTDNYVDCPGYPGAEVSPNKYEYEYKA